MSRGAADLFRMEHCSKTARQEGYGTVGRLGSVRLWRLQQHEAARTFWACKDPLVPCPSAGRHGARRGLAWHSCQAKPVVQRQSNMGAPCQRPVCMAIPEFLVTFGSSFWPLRPSKCVTSGAKWGSGRQGRRWAATRAARGLPVSVQGLTAKASMCP